MSLDSAEARIDLMIFVRQISKFILGYALSHAFMLVDSFDVVLFVG